MGIRHVDPSACITGNGSPNVAKNLLASRAEVEVVVKHIEGPVRRIGARSGNAEYWSAGLDTPGRPSGAHIRRPEVPSAALEPAHGVIGGRGTFVAVPRRSLGPPDAFDGVAGDRSRSRSANRIRDHATRTCDSACAMSDRRLATPMSPIATSSVDDGTSVRRRGSPR